VDGNVANSYYRGLTVKVNGSTVSIFATKSNSAGTLGQQLMKLVDNSGYNGALTGTPVMIASVTNAGTMSMRGVARVPLGCLAVTGLRVPDVSATEANIIWSAPPNGGSNYEYAITTSAIPPASGSATTSTSANIQGLTNGVTYYAHVRTICSVLSTSEWSTVSFVTGCKASPLTLININITDTGAVNIKWNKVFGALAYEYVVSTSNVATATGTEISDTTITLNGLNSVTQYYVHIRSKCAGGSYSPWATKPFSTGCFTPKARLMVIPATATASWSRVTNAAQYEYAFTYSANKPLSGNFTGDTSVSINKIGQTIVYYFHVRSKCANGAVSEWASLPIVMEGLQAYPNPVSDQLQVRLNGIASSNGEIKVVDVMGRIIKHVRFTNNTVAIDTRAWPAGIYFVRYNDGNNKYTVRIMKQ
jgi:hypothetical protein